MDITPSTAMVAPPGQLPATIASALSKLSKTPAGIPNFMITFTSALGSSLASTRKSAQAGTLNKSHAHAIKLLGIMYHCLISCVPDDNHVVEMTEDCGLDTHLCLNWLQRKHAPTTTTSVVKALLSIFQEDFVGGNIVAGIEKKIAANDALAHKINLEDSVLRACASGDMSALAISSLALYNPFSFLLRTEEALDLRMVSHSRLCPGVWPREGRIFRGVSPTCETHFEGFQF